VPSFDWAIFPTADPAPKNNIIGHQQRQQRFQLKGIQLVQFAPQKTRQQQVQLEETPPTPPFDALTKRAE
jgi:hypothetical protein